MSKLQMWALALAVSALPFAARAGDKEEVKTVTTTTPEVTTTTTTTEVKTEVVYEDEGGSKFMNFWKHRVGGTIHRGLTKGTDKVAKTF